MSEPRSAFDHCISCRSCVARCEDGDWEGAEMSFDEQRTGPSAAFVANRAPTTLSRFVILYFRCVQPRSAEREESETRDRDEDETNTTTSKEELAD